MTTVEVTAGQLLVATPLIGDGNFDRSVVFLLEHNAEGSLGVVLNNPTEQAIEVPGAAWTNLLGSLDVVFSGGPVSPDAFVTLAHLKPQAESTSWIQVWDRIVTLDPDVEIDEAAGEVEAIRLFSGYSGWSPGQLRAEIDAGAWFVVDADPHDVLSSRPDRLWDFVLSRQPGTVAWFANYPEDPAFN